MKRKCIWKSVNRLGGVMSAWLIVLTLGMFGLSAWEVEWNPGQAAASTQQPA